MPVKGMLARNAPMMSTASGRIHDNRTSSRLRIPCTMAGRTSVRCSAQANAKAVTGMANQGSFSKSIKKLNSMSLNMAAPSPKTAQKAPTNRAENWI